MYAATHWACCAVKVSQIVLYFSQVRNAINEALKLIKNNYLLIKTVRLPQQLVKAKRQHYIGQIAPA